MARQTVRVGGAAEVQRVIDDEPVAVVCDLGLVAELDWFAEPSCAEALDGVIAKV